MLLFVVTAAVVMACCSPAAVSSAGEGATINIYKGMWPSHVAVKLDTDRQDLLAKVSDLIDFHKGDFSGVEVDAEGHIHLYYTTLAGEKLAESEFGGSEGVSIRQGGDLSVLRTNDLGVPVGAISDSLRKKLYAISQDPSGMTLHVGVTGELSDDEIMALQTFGIEQGLELDVYVNPEAEQGEPSSRLEDDSPYAGGFRIIRSNDDVPSGATGASCTAGFPYSIDSNRYMLGAGHCFYRGSSFKYMWSTYSGACCTKKQYAGQRSYSTWDDGTGTVRAGTDDQWHGDLSLVNVTIADRNVSSYIWWGTPDTTNKIPVTARRAPTYDDPICINGAVSGSDCGVKIYDTNIPWYYDNGETVLSADVGYSLNSVDCSQHGDSGGSIILNHSGAETQATAIGIVSGAGHSSNGCTQVFTGVEEAMQAWGAD